MSRDPYNRRFNRPRRVVREESQRALAVGSVGLVVVGMADFHLHLCVVFALGLGLALAWRVVREESQRALAESMVKCAGGAIRLPVNRWMEGRVLG